MKKLKCWNRDSKVLEKEVEAIQATLGDLSHDFSSKEELDDRISKVKQDQVFNHHRLQQLMEINKEQQQVIHELGAKYTELNENYLKQQSHFADVTKQYEEKFSRYEENLTDAKCKLAEIELEIINGSDFMKAMGVRRSENMIRKEKFEAKPTAVRSLNAPKPQIQVQDLKAKAREKLQMARNQRKIERESGSAVGNNATIRAEPPLGLTTKAYSPNFQRTTPSETPFCDIPSPKETLCEVDMNSF